MSATDRVSLSALSRDPVGPELLNDLTINAGHDSSRLILFARLKSTSFRLYSMSTLRKREEGRGGVMGGMGRGGGKRVRKQDFNRNPSESGRSKQSFLLAQTDDRWSETSGNDGEGRRRTGKAQLCR